MHVQKESRKSGEGRKLVNELAEIAKSRGCNIITGNVQLNDPGSSNTLLAALLVGFRVVSANGVSLLIAKELGE
jgi:predicted GNAT superfamily acetyltransferase